MLVTKNSADSIQDQSAGRDYSGTLRFYPQGAEDEPVSYCQCPALMNPLMILVKIIKLRWIHILSYDQMVSRKINNQTT
ncbi:hypothetical protein ACNAT8_17425, partial [Klebsiella quasipneumoniae]|uniref:hypothetical protein n=1 Tax=Klebsiella quasipneumoniae TaxID=1463165 RepID=UPI002AB8F244